MCKQNLCIIAPEEMLLGKAMISGQWRCCVVKNKYMKRIENQFRTDQLLQQNQYCMGIIAAGE